ncbi:MAG TPA: hypothetical protein VLN26_18440, partial [Gaiellaceae bacterium]|nr:hypothetical protein [Gaiellaceae bacterium]
MPTRIDVAAIMFTKPTAVAGASGRAADAPATAVGFVNMIAATLILVGNPLLGLGFSAPGDGRIGFAVVAALWLASLSALP